MPLQFPCSLRARLNRPGVFYTLVLLGVFAVQGLSLAALLEDSDQVRRVIPIYTHVLALTFGTLFLFRGLQLLLALLWTEFVSDSTPLAPYDRSRPDLPFVTVQIPTRDEPLEVARIAIDAAFGLDYPSDKLEIQLVDNSSSEDFCAPVRDYLEGKVVDHGGRVEASYLHREGTKGFKAGNLNMGLKSARGEFVLILDADSTVPPDFLLSGLPYFEDPTLGFTQMRIDAINENATVVSRAAAITTKARFRLMDVRTTQGVAQFDGHNGIFRRQAIDDIGGWVEQVSEDLATSVEVVLAGYTSRYVDLASGELVPDQFNELFKQRRRWALGTMVFLRKDGLRILRSNRLNWFQKLDLFYAVLNIFVEASACVLVFTFAPLPALTVAGVILIFSVLPTLLSARLGFWKVIPRQAGVILVMSSILPALVHGAIAGLRDKPAGFEVTRKSGGVATRFVGQLRTYATSIAAALVFFGVTAWLSPSVADFFNSYLSGALLMASVLLGPFVLNALPDTNSREDGSPAPDDVRTS